MPKAINKTPSVKKGPKIEKAVSGFINKGFSDVSPKDSEIWNEIRKASSSIADLHGFHFMHTPAVESATFFEKALGKDKNFSDVHWYSIKSGAKERLILRPTGLFPILRSYITNHLGYFSSPLKAFFCGSSFIKTKTSDDEFEGEFNELGFTVIGDNDPVYDVEIIESMMHFLKLLKIKKTVLKINTNGCRTCRGQYQDKIRSFCVKQKDNLCKKCLRSGAFASFLACDDEKCKELRASAPIILDYLCQNCNNHFKSLIEILEEDNILYELDPNLIRGGNIWNRIVFSIYSQSGARLAVGGRFDYLAESFGGRAVPAVGGIVFLDRIAETLKMCANGGHKEKPKVFFIAIGDHAKKASVRLLTLLRDSGIGTIEALGKKSLKVQLKTAERMKVPMVLLLGQKEVYEESVIVRDMQTGAQETVTINQMTDIVKKRLKEM